MRSLAARVLLRPAKRQELVQIGGAGGWWIPRWAAEPPGLVYSAAAEDDRSFEDALRERGLEVVVFDAPGGDDAGLSGVLTLMNERPNRWVNLIRVRVGPEEHDVLGALLEGGPRPGILCVELEPPASAIRTARTVTRWRLAGYSLARADGTRLTFVPRSSLGAAAVRRVRLLLRLLAGRSAPARIVHGNPLVTRRVLALTFDDGPSDRTPPILDSLRDANARATFFVVGESVAGREDILGRMHAEGHEIGNHSFSHRSLAGLDATAVRSELSRTNKAIAAAVGAVPRIFRPPYFADGDVVRRAAGAEGLAFSVYAPVWTQERDQSAEEIVEAILDSAYPGAIVLLHDGPDRHATVEAVRSLVPALCERGYELVTVSELLAL